VHFTVREDLDELVPLIHDARKISREGFKIVASPWTAPPWMKDNNAWYGGSLKPEFYPTWALYLSKYVREYEKLGIPIWAVTPVNEPLGYGAQWDSMVFTPRQMADFIALHLGSRFAADSVDARILCYDQNRDELITWALAILDDPKAARHVWGIAVHWYGSTISWYPEVLQEIHERYPDKPILHTEGCIDTDSATAPTAAWR
jgi:glucosylceramidase